MSRTAVFVAGISLALLGVGTAQGAARRPAGYSVAERSAVHPGVHYRRMVKAARPVLAHVAHVEAGAAVDLRVVSASDKVPNRYADLETTGSMCRRVECLVAVNGDFIYQEQPVGGVVSGGRMIRSPDPSRPQLTIDAGGGLSAGGFPWTGSLVLSNGVRIPLAGINVAPRDGVVLYTEDWGAQTSAPGRIEVVAAMSAPAGLLNQRTPAELQQRRAVPGPIPPGGAVLSAGGSAAEVLEKAWKDLQRKAITSQAQLLVESPVNAAESLGANPVVLRGGRRALPWPEDPNVISEVHPRTLVGWNAAGDRFIVAVDGRQPSSAGLTMAEAADFLLGLGATDAVNLDGGGGTTFVVGGSLRNRPSDHPEQNPPPERVAPNALAVVARPDAVATPPSPIRPLTLGAPAVGGDAPPPDGAALTSPGGPSARWTWGDPDPGGATAPDAGEGMPGQPDDEAGGGVQVATLVEGAVTGRLTDGRPGPVTAGPPAARPTGASTPSGADGPAPDETALSLPVAAAGVFRPAHRPPALAEHPATRVAAGLLLLQWGLLAAAAVRGRRPAVT